MTAAVPIRHLILHRSHYHFLYQLPNVICRQPDRIEIDEPTVEVGMLKRNDPAEPPKRRLSHGQLSRSIAHLLRTASYEQHFQRPRQPQSRKLPNEL
jgi:hypothetical protein